MNEDMEHPLYSERYNQASYPHECTISVSEMEAKQYEENNSHRWAANTKTNNMKASELRIGNWVNFKDTPITNGNYKVMAMTELLIIASNGGAGYPDEVSPIQLTEDWLLKFDFEYVGNDMYVLGSFLITRDETDNVFYFDIDNPFSTPIHYIHQLQNLYFALTNQELKLL